MLLVKVLFFFPLQISVFIQWNSFFTIQLASNFSWLAPVFIALRMIAGYLPSFFHLKDCYLIKDLCI
jgi:hypothetical protein